MPKWYYFANCTVLCFAEKGEIKIAPSPLLPRKEKTTGAVKRANSYRLKRGMDLSKLNFGMMVSIIVTSPVSFSHYTICSIISTLASLSSISGKILMQILAI